MKKIWIGLPDNEVVDISDVVKFTIRTTTRVCIINILIVGEDKEKKEILMINMAQIDTRAHDYDHYDIANAEKYAKEILLGILRRRPSVDVYNVVPYRT